jgi:hypothetical protein
MIRRIRVRRGTASDWSTINPILSEGEFGYSTNDGQLKVGNGSSPWNDLRSLVASDRQLTVNGTANQITVNTPSQNLAANPSWILSLPQNIHIGTLGLGTNAPSDFGFDVLTGNTAGNRHLFTVNGGLRFQRRGDTSGWAFTYGVMTNDNLVSGGFGATGSNTQINYYYIGADLNDTLFRIAPATGIILVNRSTALGSHRLQVSGGISLGEGNELDWANGSMRIIGLQPDASNRAMAFQTWNSSSGIQTRWTITSTGIWESNGSQTIRTSSGSLILATGGANGNISLTPNGSGEVFLNSTTVLGGNLLRFTSVSGGWNEIRGNITRSGITGGTEPMFRVMSHFDELVLQAGVNDANPKSITLRSGLTQHGLTLNTNGRIGVFSTNVDHGRFQINSTVHGMHNQLALAVVDGTNNPRAIIRQTTSSTSHLIEFDSSFTTGSGLANWRFVSGWLQAGNIRLNGNVISSENLNGNIRLTPNGSGTLQIDGISTESPTSSHDFLLLDTSGSLVRRINAATALSHLGAVPVTRTITLNGIAHDLSSNRVFNVGTVTSVSLAAPAGFVVSNNPLTTAGTLTLGFAPGFSLPSNAAQDNWNTAYGWGDFRITGFGTDTAIEYTSIGGSADNLPLLSGLYAANAISGDLPNNNSKFYSVVIKDGAGITSGIDLQLAFSEYIGATSGPGSNFGLFLRDVNNGSSNGWKRFWDTTDFAMSQVENWDVAFSWGDHSAAGYLLSSSASTTYVALSGSYNNPAWLTGLAWSKITGVPTSFTPSAHNHAASDITSGTISYARLPFGASDVNNWNSAFTWGNHSTAGYLLSNAAATTYVALAGSYNNPSWITGLAWSKITGVPSSFTPSAHNHSASEITSGTLAYARLPFGLNDVNNWNTAVGWGNHAVAGYLTSSAAASSYVALAGSYSNPSWITALAWNKITGVPALAAPEEYVKVHLDVNNAVIPSRITPLINSTLYHIPGNAASNSGIYTPIIWDIEAEDIGDRFDSGVIAINPGEIWQITASIECFWAQQGTGSSWVAVYGQSPMQGISLDLVIVEVDVNSNEEIIAKQTTDGVYARHTDPPFFNEEERSLWMNTEVNHQYHNNTSSQTYLYIAARSWLPHNLGINPSPEVTRLTAKRLK